LKPMIRSSQYRSSAAIQVTGCIFFLGSNKKNNVQNNSQAKVLL
jgi:hypothetical protein